MILTGDCRDIEEQRKRGNLGDPKIDAPVWIKTLELINRTLAEVKE